MGGLPDPLDRTMLGPRLLTDRGLRTALKEGYLSFDPPLPLDSARIQPMTIDLLAAETVDGDPLNEDNSAHFWERGPTLWARHENMVRLTERISWKSIGHEEGLGISQYIVAPATEAKSSLRRLGPSIAHTGGFFFVDNHGNNEIAVLNTTHNDIRYSPGDAFTQMYGRVDPFFDETKSFPREPSPVLREWGERVRAIDMMVASGSSQQTHELSRRGYFEVSSRLKTTREGLVIVHAGERAYRLPVLDGGIDFSKRKEYAEMLEPIDLRKGYTIQPFEHIIVETQESLSLSPHVALLFYDNLINQVFSRERRKLSDVIDNTGLLNLLDGLVDPGYSGGFSRQPKTYTGRVIRTGDPIGYAAVLFSEKGVEMPYGSEGLGSHYQGSHSTTMR